MGFHLDARSRANLAGVHPDLVRVVMRAALLSPIPFRVTEGLRTLERQRKLKAQGLSKTLNSRHLTGHAVDLVPAVDLNGDGRVTGDEMWHHSQLVKLSPYIKQAFRAEGVPFEWGGDWRNAWDKPHWQLPWKQYPVRRASIDGNLMVAMAEAPMETPAIRTTTAGVIGEGGAGLGGVALLGDAVAQLQQAEGHFSAGTLLGGLIGLLVLAGAGLALWTRWDAAGRPLPGFLRRVLPA